MKNGEDIRSELQSLYRRHWQQLVDALNTAEVDKGSLGGPFLMDVFPEYLQASKRLLIVGQQTGGWGHAWDKPVDDAVRELMALYSEFHLGEHYLPTPFWGAAWQVFRRVNPQGPHYGFLWTNLVKVDQDEHEAEWGIKEIVARTFPVLSEEIRIISPDAVVFFTGPNFDHWIKLGLPGVTFDPVRGLTERLCAKLKHSVLPSNTYRVFHPRGIMLVREPKPQDYYRRILDLVGSNLT